MKTTVIENQSIVDIGVQESGSALAAFDLAFENGLSITDELEPGQQLNEIVSVDANKNAADYFKGKKQMIACGSNVGTEELPEKPVGIGAMIIQNDFIVG